MAIYELTPKQRADLHLTNENCILVSPCLVQQRGTERGTSGRALFLFHDLESGERYQWLFPPQWGFERLGTRVLTLKFAFAERSVSGDEEAVRFTVHQDVDVAFIGLQPDVVTFVSPRYPENRQPYLSRLLMGKSRRQRAVATLEECVSKIAKRRLEFLDFYVSESMCPGGDLDDSGLLG